MPSNTENTEAKLAAYIDGQLPAAERAELDHFLAKNPDLQKLLSDLIAQRALLRTLPRDRAPSDIYDTIQAQLERSVLLDDSALTIAPPVRHSRKSQLFAIAAMFLLAVGLGAVLYFALPSSKPTPVEVAATSRPDAVAAIDESEAKGTLSLRPTRQTIPLADAGIASLPPSSIASNVSTPSPLVQALGGSTGGEFKSQLQSTQSPPQDQVVLLVSTNDPAKASREVTSYLAANNISYESVDPAAQQQQAFYNGVDGLVIGAAPKSVDLGKNAGELDVKPAPDEAAPSANRRAAVVLDRDQDPLATQQQTQTPTADRTDASPANQEAAPTTVNQIVADNLAAAPTSRGTVPRAARPYFIARNITREQAAQLTQTLSTEETSQRARLVTDAPVQKFAAQVAPATPAAVSPEFTLSLTRQFAATQATTLPVETATTAPTTQSNDSLDIVIVVEDQQPATAPATTAPASTAPAATEPATQP